ncbi:hypothetical protein [Hymenobacter cellulosilyticus]|uniref:Uncharacterized protein n=1 Tax=Hymenobacter cellulosilyticus TaxID=2932248 RepID=A0A8T9QGJ7_9BACT|nr:hypothetical protein [Hymenobacter cellulosilyticus]UOQ74699.1 hypothetical protein MUN79_12980 [Hymenobacter cellulosilyticus]
MLLEYFTGSNAWPTLALPLNAQEPVGAFANGLCFDAKRNLLVTEQGWGDTILTVHNLKTQQEQHLIEEGRPCDAISCLDSASIDDGLLYYKWTVQNSSLHAISTERRVRLSL